MTAKSIPEVGEVFKGYVPAQRQVLHVTYGPDTTADVITTDCGVYKLVDVGMPVIVWSAEYWVATAFTASVTSDIGDTGTADRYYANGTTGDTTVDTALQADTLAAPFWDTAGLDINVTIAGAVPAVGLAHLFVEYSPLDD